VHPVDLAVFTVAAQQCGLFSRRQVIANGGSDALIRRRLASGRWLAATTGVYALPGHPASFRRTLWLAFLSAPPEAVVSHWSGGAVRALGGFPPDRFTLSVPHGRYPRNPVARTFQTVAMPKATLVDGLPVASVERILIDVAGLVGPRKLRALVELARTAGATNPVRLRREHVRLARPGRRGIAQMGVLLSEYEEGAPPPRSALEARLDALLARVPAPVRHEAPLPGREWSNERVDRRFDEPRRLIVEGDSRRYHARVADFRRDRERDRVALRHGYPTMRYAFEELVHDEEAVLEEILDVLGLSESSPLGFR
jgi:hypothetical protein